MDPHEDVHQTLDYQPPVRIVVAGSVILAAGLGAIAVALVRCFKPGRPMFVLSPSGIRYHLARTNTILIPWREIKGVDIVDITVRRWSLRGPPFRTLRNVTVILLSKPFYDSYIFI